jgi:Arc-like DNA binding dprotein
LRFQEGLRRRLEHAAARNNRSMNTEIIHRLQRTLARDDTVLAPIMFDFFEDLKRAGVDIGKGKKDDIAHALQNLFARFSGEPPVQQTKSHERDDK